METKFGISCFMVSTTYQQHETVFVIFLTVDYMCLTQACPTMSYISLVNFSVTFQFNCTQAILSQDPRLEGATPSLLKYASKFSA